MPPTDTNFNIDEHMKERLMKYAPAGLHNQIEQLLSEGKATVHDFINEEELLFLPQEELEKKIQTLRDQPAQQAMVPTSKIAELKKQADELNALIDSSLNTLDAAQAQLANISIDKS